jgi:hypothetical protein
MFGIEVRVGERWEKVHPAFSAAYEFETRIEAETMARLLYPEQYRQRRLGWSEAVRIVDLSKEEAKV